MAPLANFLRDELPKRGWTIPEWAPKASLSVSNAYLIVRDGKDNVRSSTFNNIAASLGMTPVELGSAIVTGADLAPEEARLLALFRQVPEDRRPAATDMLRGLAIFVTDETSSPVPPAQLRSNGGRADATKRQQAGVGQHDDDLGEGVKKPRNGSPSRHYPSIPAVFLNLFGRLPSPSPAL